MVSKCSRPVWFLECLSVSGEIITDFTAFCFINLCFLCKRMILQRNQRYKWKTKEMGFLVFSLNIFSSEKLIVSLFLLKKLVISLLTVLKWLIYLISSHFSFRFAMKSALIMWHINYAVITALISTGWLMVW